MTIAVQKAIDDGHRSRVIAADDLVEVLLAIADRLDPPLREPNRVSLPCENCGDAAADLLVWLDEEFVRCDTCGTKNASGN